MFGSVVLATCALLSTSVSWASPEISERSIGGDLETLAIGVVQVIGEEASFFQKPKNIMDRGQKLWSEDLRERTDTAISTATPVEVAVLQVYQTRALYHQV
ncbi:hypothetical protein E2C01_053937 [Portunus trituberculatus]|uniref:Uncharacterized protein n=1 Tax=Portunus trituberculatus TaxID=210409 RepID=A0A5B7GS69_PORTR|nr:hypothetical protein [Portunus trituberculatus]